MKDQRLDDWTAELEARHLADLTFPEVSRALRALSSAYVERRTRLASDAALSGAGKRAAFALFYGPLHYLLVRHIVSAVPAAAAITGSLTDLGCGTGASGAAWASACAKPPALVGIDRHPWAVDEARRTYHQFGCPGRARVGDVTREDLTGRGGVLAAFTVNELDDVAREALIGRFLSHAERGGHVLVVEPLAGFVAPWWKRWQAAFEAAGGRSDHWRLRPHLPPIVEKLDRASGMHHREITGRSLWI